MSATLKIQKTKECRPMLLGMPHETGYHLKTRDQQFQGSVCAQECFRGSGRMGRGGGEGFSEREGC